MKNLLIKLAKRYLQRHGYIVKSKAECSLVPDFVLRMQENRVQPMQPIDWAEEGEIR
ncbi:hypothetical protein P7L91_03260 [Bisgaard Taxon 10/6]|uniref:Uncharacterized protein n=1 Tax=Exercitatus varius TaxID=67857 RepID=A0AAW6Q6V8_9PAST|nr:hypothetical protein [Exercitatus varius]MDG2949329.1 hypothetical protein [Exercitatus varius]MDG2959860.1 hypothetical protein [Exercitatus varius]